mmetsp:Transcript_36928/g.57772  ORF Transcript_36928/g.57772 Transcript_36928/m.57772 type:complete len:185 (-) Transcript_36928:31-585(-)
MEGQGQGHGDAPPRRCAEEDGLGVHEWGARDQDSKAQVRCCRAPVVALVESHLEVGGETSDLAVVSPCPGEAVHRLLGLFRPRNPDLQKAAGPVVPPRSPAVAASQHSHPPPVPGIGCLEEAAQADQAFETLYPGGAVEDPWVGHEDPLAAVPGEDPQEAVPVEDPWGVAPGEDPSLVAPGEDP